MDSDIQFGELEEYAPEPQLRPDRNKHFAVAACGDPDPDELPVFIDLDVLLDMEQHAQSDTSVELGGVMLGGQYQDEDGKPFVVVTDSLRAEHYESTKGSFKFTHETWSEITRQRDQFPDDLQMVGWYHTHPDWGVFLSGMDMFICDNFFNKPLDVALVIDPCRDDRGFFQWTGDPTERVRRTGGFYLTASRFRHDEVHWFAAQLGGDVSMANPRFAASASHAPYPAPVVNLQQQPQPHWLVVAVSGMLTVQLLFLVLVAWKLLTPAETPAVPPPDNSVVAQREALQRVVAQLQLGPDGIVKSLEQAQLRNDQLEMDKSGLASRIRELESLRRKDSNELDKLNNQIASLQSENSKSADRETQQLADIKVLKDRLAALGEDVDVTTTPWWKDWRWILTGLVAVVLAVVAIAIAVTLRQPENQGGGYEDPDQPPPAA